MDNIQLPQATSSLASPVNRIQPTTPGSQKEIHGDSLGTEKHVRGTASTHALEQQLFALEQHVPVNILQNPQLLKAEWAWKLLVLQQLAMHSSMSSETNARPSATPTTQSQSEAGSHTLSSADGSLSGVNNLSSLAKENALADTSAVGAKAQVIQSQSRPQSNQTVDIVSQTVFDQTPVTQTRIASSVEQPQTVLPATSSQQAPGSSQANSTSTTDMSSQQAMVGTERLEQMAAPVVHQLWQVISLLGRQSDRGPQEVFLNLRTDPPILPFNSMNQETLSLASTKTDENRLSTWVLEDRLVSSVLDNPYERVGGGVFFTPRNTEPNSPNHAVKWKADRQTRVGIGGKMIHRIRLEVQVGGHPLTCILTAQRPQLLVHFVSDQVKLRNFLDRGADIVCEPLRTCGWDLVGWTTGEPSNRSEEE